MINMLYVALGGALGASLRYAMTIMVSSMSLSTFWATLVVNILGSFGFGAIFSLSSLSGFLSEPVRLFVIVGALGSFTTFSTFSFDVVMLFKQGYVAIAGAYMVGSVVCSLVGFIAGMQLIKLTGV